jgi:hypothetical protein
VPVPFFWGWFLWLFFSKLFFDLRGISVEALSESKILKTSGHVRKPLKPGALYRKAGFALISFLPSGAFYTKSARRPRQVPGQFPNRLEVIHKKHFWFFL